MTTYNDTLDNTAEECNKRTVSLFLGSYSHILVLPCVPVVRNVTVFPGFVVFAWLLVFYGFWLSNNEWSKSLSKYIYNRCKKYVFRVEREYSAVRKQLTSEVENKKNVIGNLSKELEIHQKNFTELKEELSKAKKRQIYLEETYGGSMRELELLLDNFSVTDRHKKTSK